MVGPMMAQGLGKAKMLQMHLLSMLPWEQQDLSMTSALSFGVHCPKRASQVSNLQRIY